MAFPAPRRRRAAVAFAACAGLLGLAGCGAAQAPAPLGASVFAASCRTCHSLIGNESLRRVGGDLLGYRLSRAEMVEFVREMPVARALGATRLAAVSDYVLGLERRAVGRCSTGRC